MKIIPLSEGSFTVDASKKFVPFKPSEDDLQKHKRGSLLVEIQPFVVETEKDIILFDTGLDLLDDQDHFPLYQNLKDAGIYPDDVTKVIMSHLHKDHTGGLLNPFTRQLSFEQADYFVHADELGYALQTGGPSYATDSIEILKQSDQLKLLHGPSGTIDGYIQYEMTSAHSKHHLVFWVRENDEIAFYGGDDASQRAQMKRRFAAKYDYDGKKADSLREKWWELGNKEHWTFMFYHDAKYATYRK